MTFQTNVPSLEPSGGEFRVTRRGLVRSGAGVAGAGIIALALPQAVAAASLGPAPSGQAADGGLPTSTGFNNTQGNFFNISWKAGEFDELDVSFTYVWYYNDTSPRTLGGSGNAAGYIELDPLDSRWDSSSSGSNRTISCYIMDAAGVKYKWENKYRNNVLTFLPY